MYTRNVAIIKTLSSGYSQDGGQLSGVVTCENFDGNITLSLSLINFAKMSEGEYVYCLTDGNIYEVFSTPPNLKSDLKTEQGFALLIAYRCNLNVLPVAGAACGKVKFDVQKMLIKIKEECGEGSLLSYDDEAIAQTNYYENDKTSKDGNTVCEIEEEKEIGADICPNESNKSVPCSQQNIAFFNLVKGEVERVLSLNERCEELEKIIPRSRFVKIKTQKNSYYVFGVLFLEDEAKYICYGVEKSGKYKCRPPEGMGCLARDIGGYWMLFQDAATGESIPLKK